MTRGLERISSLALGLALTVAALGAAPVAAEDEISRHWGAEKLAVSLLNCTRTGGWVKANGTCVGRGSGKYSAYRAPLRRHQGISRKVAWKWARNMVRYEVCSHDIAGRPSLRTRMVNAGFTYGTFGENIGCGWGWGSPKEVVLRTHRLFQKERSYNGGHWQNIKNRRYKSVGVGVAYRKGTVMLVYDFYGKRY